jgi:hypothetical protein
MQSMAEDPHGRASPLFDSAVRSQSEQMLASELFRRSQRLSAFLRFVTEQTLNGRGAGLKKQVLGAEFYGKDQEFHRNSDPVCVDARCLRDKLREYYSEFPRDPMIITLPNGRYVTREAEFDAIDGYNLNDRHVVRLGRFAQRAAPAGGQLNASPMAGRCWSRSRDKRISC